LGASDRFTRGGVSAASNEAVRPGYPLVSFAQHPVTGKRIPLLSLAQPRFMRGLSRSFSQHQPFGPNRHEQEGISN
jgi:hypothetical protein